MSDSQTFFADHWKHIEDERVARYEQMFAWRDEQTQLLTPAGIEPGHHVLDFGCGPGFMTRAIAEWVGATGSALGVDINAQFIERARARSDNPPQLDYTHLDQAGVPRADASIDRVICKNVLEYVPDVGSTLTELKRVLKPGGRLHAIDSDWGFVIVQPWSKDEVDEFFAAAAPAFKEPHIGRLLADALLRAGFQEPRVQVITGPDRKGRGLSVLRNMESYIRQFGTLSDKRLRELMDRAEAAVDEGRFMLCLPQFLVTASV